MASKRKSLGQISWEARNPLRCWETDIGQFEREEEERAAAAVEREVLRRMEFPVILGPKPKAKKGKP